MIALNGQIVDDPTRIKTYDDATLSGAAVLLRLSYDGLTPVYYTKAYPTVSAAAGETIDDEGGNIYAFQDAALSGTPIVFGYLSGGKEYYAKAYPSAETATYVAGDLTVRPGNRYADATLSGTPRIAKAIVGGTAYYFKVRPVKF
jgi:hypothetical protein